MILWCTPEAAMQHGCVVQCTQRLFLQADAMQALHELICSDGHTQRFEGPCRHFPSYSL